MFNEKKFLAIYDDFLASGLTTRDYCANQQMNEAKFYYWQNKLKGQLPPKRGFVPVVFKHKQKDCSSQVPFSEQKRKDAFLNPAAGDTTISCEISYPNGVQVKLNGLIGEQTLRSLLLLTAQQGV